MKHFQLFCLVFFTGFLSLSVFAQQANSFLPQQHADKSSAGICKSKNTTAFFDLLYNWPVQKTSEAGIETDGTFLYTAVWASDSAIQRKIYKYNLTGAVLDSFVIDSVVGLRDLAYNANYFYGGNSSNSIYKMDFTLHTVVDTIVCPAYVQVRSIAYDPVHDGFWVSGWNTDIWLINRATGSVVDTIPFASHQLIGMFGSAYDSISAGGPYLWVFDQNTSANQNDLVQITIANGLPSGVVHDVTTDFTVSPGSVAGGLFTYYNPGTFVTTLGGLVQGSTIFGYDLSTMVVTSDVGVVEILTPQSACGLTANETVKVVVKNYGFNTVSNFDITFKYNIFTNTEVHTNALAPFATDTFTFATALDLSIDGISAVLSAYTGLVGDAFASNDTAFKLTTHVALVSPAYEMDFETPAEFEGWKALDNNNDGNTWQVKQENPFTGNYSAVYTYNPYQSADDWLFSKCISLKKDTDYVLNFYYRVKAKTYPEKLKVKISTTQNDTNSMVKTIVDLGAVIDTVYKLSAKSFKVDADGTYYIAWNCYSDLNEWKLYIDHVQLFKGLVGIDEVETENHLSIFPNPASDQIQIHSGEVIHQLSMTNLLGQEVYAKTLHQTDFTLDVSSIEAGIYFVKASTTKGVSVKKIQIIGSGK